MRNLVFTKTFDKAFKKFAEKNQLLRSAAYPGDGGEYGD